MGKVFDALVKAEKEPVLKKKKSKARTSNSRTDTEKTESQSLVPDKPKPVTNAPRSDSPIISPDYPESSTVRQRPVYDQEEPLHSAQRSSPPVSLQPKFMPEERYAATISPQPIPDMEEIIKKQLELKRKYKGQFQQRAIMRKKKLKKGKDNLFALHRPTSVIAEQFRIMRTFILKISTNQDMKTILVTSSTPGEGKSFVASNLAASIAQGFDKHVLLIDADLRRPTLHEVFGIKTEKGLSDYLLDEHLILSNLIHKSNKTKLSILPAGTSFENSSELLASEIMGLFIQEVKYRYDDRYVIFDSPPTQISESLALAEKMDGIIVVVKAGETGKKLVAKTVEALGKDKVLGVILNYCDFLPKSYYQYYR